MFRGFPDFSLVLRFANKPMLLDSVKLNLRVLFHHGVPKKSELMINNFGNTIFSVRYYSKLHAQEDNLAKAVGKSGR